MTQNRNLKLCRYLFGHWVRDEILYKAAYDRYFTGTALEVIINQSCHDLGQTIGDLDRSNPTPIYTALVIIAYAESILYRDRER
jgi:hypothetical protein